MMDELCRLSPNLSILKGYLPDAGLSFLKAQNLFLTNGMLMKGKRMEQLKAVNKPNLT